MTVAWYWKRLSTSHLSLWIIVVLQYPCRVQHLFFNEMVLEIPVKFSCSFRCSNSITFSWDHFRNTLQLDPQPLLKLCAHNLCAGLRRLLVDEQTLRVCWCLVVVAWALTFYLTATLCSQTPSNGDRRTTSHRGPSKFDWWRCATTSLYLYYSGYCGEIKPRSPVKYKSTWLIYSPNLPISWNRRYWLL